MQKVTVSCLVLQGCIQVYPCREHVFAVLPFGEDETYTYYEAWPIVFGERRTQKKINLYNDEASYPSKYNTEGFYKQEGEIRFFCNNVIGSDLENDKKWHNPAKSGVKWHGKLCQTTSYLLLSWSEEDNNGPPEFWNLAMDGEKMATRSFDLKWSCCNPKGKPELDVKPPKT